MTEIYCHIHTPINIEEESICFLPPIIFEGNLYAIKEKTFHDILIYIGYFQEYIKLTRENGYDVIPKWLKKKNLLNSNFLETVSKYWIEDTNLKQVNNYKYFQKNNENIPVIPDKYLKDIFKKFFLYDYIKENQTKFNEIIEKKLNIIENELSFINNENSYKIRQSHYQKNFFNLVLDNFLENTNFDKQCNELNSISFKCENLLTQYDLFVYKIGCISEYKDFNFKLIKKDYSECLRENSFIKLNAYSNIGHYQNDYLKYTMEKLKLYSQSFTNDTIDFGVEHLKRIIKVEVPITKKMPDIIKYSTKEAESSNVAIIQKTHTFISETEDHIISRYNSLKNYTNIYFAPDNEITKFLVILNMNNEKLKRFNELISDKPNKIESELIKFTFKKGNLPYSAYGFACLNF